MVKRQWDVISDVKNELIHPIIDYLLQTPFGWLKLLVEQVQDVNVIITLTHIHIHKIICMSNEKASKQSWIPLPNVCLCSPTHVTSLSIP